MTQQERDLLQEVKVAGLTKLQELISSGADPSSVAFLSTAYNKLAKAEDLSVIAEGLLKVGVLEDEVSKLRSEVAGATTSGFVPVLFRDFRNGTNNNWRVKPMPFTEFSEEAGLLTLTNFQVFADKLKTQYLPEFRLHTTGGFFYEDDRKTYDNGWNEYNGVLSIWFLKNTTQEDLQVDLQVIQSSGDWPQHRSTAIANGIILHKLTSNTPQQTFNHQFTVPAGAEKFPVAVFTGAYRWACWYGCMYVVRHFVKLSLPEGVTYDLEAYKTVGGIV